MPKEVLLQGKTMGTTYSVKLYIPEEQLKSMNLYSDVDQALEKVNQQMSTYLASSEVSKFNAANEGDVVAFSKQTANVIAESIELGNLTSGALDITIEPLVNLWGFGPEGRIISAPSAQDVIEVKSQLGLDKLVLEGNTITKPNAQLTLNLNAIAKGYGVDVVAELLESKGITNYLVEVGGEMRISGKKPNGNWQIAIEKPTANERAIQRVIATGTMGIATSGDYRSYFEDNGVRYSHLIDPNTGKPINHNLVSVTVLHPSCMIADGLATAINVMGPEKGLQLAEQENIPILMVLKTADGFEERTSNAFKPYLN
ncbi:FAD:protein FMN transferase [Flocculibacter collagenilyticus]|uniref:FAD:protein FMN transferase n=1 Tax=Flocculibacter collagenilyticus TaxID=2744479 RepID=UPI001F2FC4C0|nr:FAD:protein FMN transferase [Flocculibacter collagenilyticus]